MTAITDQGIEMTSLSSDLNGDYTIDSAHTEVGFVARHAMISKVRGSFSEFEGSGHLDVGDLTNSRVELVIQADSIDTGNADRDAHLRTNDFFDMENHPTISFRSTGIQKTGDDSYLVEGDLTMKGVTKQVAIPFDFTGTAVDPFGNRRIGFEGSVRVNRRDWGINWNAALEAGGVLVGDKVTLEFAVSAIKS